MECTIPAVTRQAFLRLTAQRSGPSDGLLAGGPREAGESDFVPFAALSEGLFEESHGVGGFPGPGTADHDGPAFIIDHQNNLHQTVLAVDSASLFGGC